MKKFFLLAAMVGVALTGCMKNEVYVPKCDTPISFEVANYVAQTRAAGAFEYTSFGVNAWSHDAAAAAGAEVKMMDNEDVSLIGGKWTTTTPYYWPINGTVDFIAYYPTSVEPEIVYDYNGADTYTYDDYTVETVADGVDLMYADKAIRFSANNTADANGTNLSIGSYGFEGVPTLFRHALAKINFKVQNANPADDGGFTYEVIVKGITLKIYNQGSVTLTNEGTATASRGTWKLPTDNVWTPTDADATLATLTWTGDVSLTNDTAVEYKERTQYVLPQALVADKQNITVEYTVIQRQGTKEISRKNYTVNSYLADWILKKWEMNKNITYTISIAKETTQILFAPAVEEWVDDESGSIVIENEAEKHA